MKRRGTLRPHPTQLTATGDGAADSPRFLSTRDGEEGSVSAAELLTNVYLNTQPFLSVPPQERTNRDQEQHDKNHMEPWIHNNRVPVQKYLCIYVLCPLGRVQQQYLRVSNPALLAKLRNAV